MDYNNASSASKQVNAHRSIANRIALTAFNADLTHYHNVTCVSLFL
ncbi:MAG: hypothetical protein ACI9ZV_000918, partial [Candidatus Azotimanducaceae bacterium]